jgi:hypothetical protein
VRAPAHPTDAHQRAVLDYPRPLLRCPRCGGFGHFVDRVDGYAAHTRPCLNCGGRGWVFGRDGQ